MEENKTETVIDNEEQKSSEPIENTDAPETQNSKPETNNTEQHQKQIDELNDKFLRLYSEFDNYKRRTSKEKIEIITSAGKSVISTLLPVLDDFERAIKSNENIDNVAVLKDGIKLIHNKLNSILIKNGLEPMDAKGQEFNSDLHEAITNVPAPTEEMKGKVIEELERGYYLNGKVIRYAKVIVGN